MLYTNDLKTKTITYDLLSKTNILHKHSVELGPDYTTTYHELQRIRITTDMRMRHSKDNNVIITESSGGTINWKFRDAKTGRLDDLCSDGEIEEAWKAGCDELIQKKSKQRCMLKKAPVCARQHILTEESSQFQFSNIRGGSVLTEVQYGEAKINRINIRKKKKEVLNRLRKGESCRKLAEEYGISKSTVSNINKNSAAIIDAWENNCKSDENVGQENEDNLLDEISCLPEEYRNQLPDVELISTFDNILEVHEDVGETVEHVLQKVISSEVNNSDESSEENEDEGATRGEKNDIVFPPTHERAIECVKELERYAFKHNNPGMIETVFGLRRAVENEWTKSKIREKKQCLMTDFFFKK
ncbi:hypothetical protein C0J52_12588 [Blattella germanica]|nr:hypothetical protein C0J52_12588 [Blattella germanica]